MSEPLSRLLAELPPAEPDPVWAERIRMRCRARLVRRAQQTSVWRARLPGGRILQVWQPLIAILGAAYLTEVLLQAFRLYGLR